MEKSIGIKSWLANKGIAIEGFLPITLREFFREAYFGSQHYWQESFDGDFFASLSGYDDYAMEIGMNDSESSWKESEMLPKDGKR